MLSTIEKVIHLKSVNIFAQVPDNALASMAAALDLVEFIPNEQIFQKGDPGDALYIVVSGSVQIHDGEHTVDTLGERAVFGEMALLDAEPRSASVTAVDDALLLRLPSDAFHELVEDHGEIARGIIHVLSQRLRARTEDLNELRASAT